ncbi:hypothetical protein DUHN55_13030 [Helicobacter pylori]
MSAKAIFSLPLTVCGVRTATGGRSGSVRTVVTPSRSSIRVLDPRSRLISSFVHVVVIRAVCRT